MSEEVILECVKVGSKLRVRILTEGYNKDANCQFPRDIRKVGRKYKVPKDAVSFSEGRGKFFYRIKKNLITIIDENENVVVYGDVDDECVICMEENNQIVFIPCGHFCTCEICSNKIQKCPLCRSLITSLVYRDEID